MVLMPPFRQPPGIRLRPSSVTGPTWMDSLHRVFRHIKRSTLENECEFPFFSHVVAETLKQSPPTPLY